MDLAPRNSSDVQLKYKRNAFFINGFATILFLGAKLNHSCDHNVVFTAIELKGEPVIVFKTVRDVKVGEELCDNYLLNDVDHDRLLSQYGFTCDQCK